MSDVNQKPLMSEQEAWGVLEFAQALAMGELTGGFYGYNTPDLLHQSMVNLNNNAQAPTYEKLLKALNNAVNNANNLQAFTEWGEWVDMIFKRTMEYYGNILSFDLMYAPIKKKSGQHIQSSDFENSKLQADRDIVDNFLAAFNYKAEFTNMVKLMLRRETAFTWLRNNGDPINTKYTLQLMPQQYCMLTGYFEKGLLYDFDMNYFLHEGVDVEQYDPIFIIKLKNYFESATIANYNPTNPFNHRDGTYAYWIQTSPCYDEDLPHGAWAFKFDISNFNGVPFLSSLLKDTLMNIPIQKLQYDKDAAAAKAILAGEIKMLNSNEPNATAFNGQVLGNLMNLVKRALGKYCGVGAVPAENIKWFQYKDENTTMYSDQLKTSAVAGTSASRLIYSTDKMSQEEVRNAIQTDYHTVKKLYYQFNNFLEFYINKLTKWYDFAFTFDGSSYMFERQNFRDTLLAGTNIGIVPNDTVYAAALGLRPDMFRSMLMETHASNSWTDNLTVLQSVNTQSNKNGDGRPKQDDVSSDSRDYDVSES